MTRSTSALGTAVAAFADAYNSVVDALDGQQGSSQGALGGQSVVSDLKQRSADSALYSASDTASGGPASIGLELGTDGHLTFNQFKLIAADFTNPSAMSISSDPLRVEDSSKWPRMP